MSFSALKRVLILYIFLILTWGLLPSYSTFVLLHQPATCFSFGAESEFATTGDITVQRCVDRRPSGCSLSRLSPSRSHSLHCTYAPRGSMKSAMQQMKALTTAPASTSHSVNLAGQTKSSTAHAERPSHRYRETNEFY